MKFDAIVQTRGDAGQTHLIIQQNKGFSFLNFRAR